MTRNVTLTHTLDKTPMALTKQAHEEAQKKIAEIDERDADHAFELGLMKAAQDLGLDQKEYDLFRAETIARLQKAAEAPKKA